VIENMSFYNPKGRDFDMPISEISDEERNQLKKTLRDLDSKYGFIPNKACYANSYENDDYLFVADMLQDIRELHRKIYFDPIAKEWVRGNREIPYIHLDFFEQGVHNDRNLNMGVKEPTANGCHILSFNYYWLKRYLTFLQIIFDDNEDEVVEIPGVPPQQVEYKTKREIAATVALLQSMGLHEQAECLEIYVNSFFEDKIIAPILTHINIGGCKKYVWGLWDKSGTKFRVPMKKTIYNTSGFAPLFRIAHRSCQICLSVR